MGVVLFLLTYGLTVLWWAPLMALIGANNMEWAATLRWAPQLGTLRSRTEAQLYQLLMTTHWVRLGLVTANALVMFWVAQIEFSKKV
jgi:hypothetical protein